MVITPRTPIQRNTYHNLRRLLHKLRYLTGVITYRKAKSLYDKGAIQFMRNVGKLADSQVQRARRMFLNFMKTPITYDTMIANIANLPVEGQNALLASYIAQTFEHNMPQLQYLGEIPPTPQEYRTLSMLCKLIGLSHIAENKSPHITVSITPFLCLGTYNVLTELLRGGGKLYKCADSYMFRTEEADVLIKMVQYNMYMIHHYIHY